VRWWLLWPRQGAIPEERRRSRHVLGSLCILGAVLVYAALFWFVRDLCDRGQARQDVREEAYRACLGSGRAGHDCRSAARRSR
jgi:hypothetical protein